MEYPRLLWDNINRFYILFNVVLLKGKLFPAEINKILLVIIIIYYKK